MADIRENVLSVIDGMSEVLNKNGFSSVNTQQDNVFAFESSKGTLRITFDENKIYLFTSDGSFEDTPEEAYKRIALSLIDSESTAADIRYISNDFSETVESKFGAKTAVKKNNYKAPPTISKAAVKGGQSYDASTLASKICQVYPELRQAFRDNANEYGEFLPEEFFTKHANALIVDTIKKNDPQTMKKLFNILNEIYDDGSSEVQDIIAVTILGELNNDTELLATCVDYMNDSMAPVVIAVNKYLASPGGKKARKKMLNPPPYKPKKEKRKGFMASLMEQQSNLQQ